MAGWVLAATLSCLMAGCATPRATGSATSADALRAACGSAPCLTADLMARVQPPAGEPQSVEVAVRRREDGRLRLDLAKADVVGVSLLAEADGALTVLLPRDRAVAHLPPTPTDPARPPTVLALARLLAQELAEGPLQAGEGRRAADGLHLRDPATGLEAVLTLDGPDGLPSAKRLLAADGRLVMAITYDKWKRFGTVQRPSRCTITIVDGPGIELRVVRLRPVAAIASGGLSLAIPADAHTMTWEQLGDLLAPPPVSALPR